MEENLVENISNFCQDFSKIEQMSLEQLWETLKNAIEFREKIHANITETNGEQIAELVRKITYFESKLYTALYQKGKQKPELHQNLLRENLSRLEQKIRYCTNHINQSPLVIALQLRGYAIEMLWFKYLALHLEVKNGHSMLADILNEIHTLSAQATIAPKIFQHTSVQQILENLKSQSLQYELQSFEKQAEQLITQAKSQIQSKETSLNNLIEAMLWSNRIQSQSSDFAQKTCLEKRQKLAAMIRLKFTMASLEQKLAFLNDFIIELQEAAQEIIGNADDNKMPNSIANLEQLYEDSKWLEELASEASHHISNHEIINKENSSELKNDKIEADQPPQNNIPSSEKLNPTFINNKVESSQELAKSLKTISKKIIKVQKYLKAEIQEKKLQLRMESIFGKRAVSILEIIILVLTLLVIVIIFAEVKFRKYEDLFTCDIKYAKDLNLADTFHPETKPLPQEFIKLFEKNYILSHHLKIKTISDSKEWEIEDTANNFYFLIYANSIIEDEVEKTYLKVYRMSNWMLYLMILDLIICIIFIFEFILKFSLCQGKWLYFRRHFLIDVLPAIPFGWIALSLEKLDYSRSARLFRLLRLQRLIRYVRIIRPLVRIFRVAIFFVRGIDRLAHRYSKWLNYNIVFFDTIEKISTATTLQYKIQKLRNECLTYNREILRKHANTRQLPYFLPYLHSLQVQLEENSDIISLKGNPSKNTDLSIENIIHTLLNIRDSEIEDILGSDFPLLIHKYFGMLDFPMIRSLPGVSKIVRKHRKSMPAEFAAFLCRMFGRILQKILNVIYWFSDLYGIVTGPRILSRIAKVLVESFQQPAKRLLIFGGSFILLNLAMSAIPSPILHKVLGILNRYIGFPLVIIGGICSIPLALGWWLRNLAGEATEFYERTAEAQFINLLKEIKWRNTQQDLSILYQRVIAPELSLATSSQNLNREEIIQSIQQKIHWWKFTERKSVRENNSFERLQEQIILLYRDYLDGPVLHRSDVKTTEQFLGNLTLSNIRNHRLQYNRKQLKELSKLDLDKPSLFSGPYLWFNLITDSICQGTAQLIIEYNRHAIPLDILSLQSKDIQQQYQDWLSSQKNQSIQKKGRNLKDTAPLYLTTQFTALHFLAQSPVRDEEIRRHFGEEVYQSFLHSRQEIIHNTFGSYPLPKLPQIRRTFNPYSFYENHVSSGKIFFLPFKFIGVIFAFAGVLLRWVCKKIGEIRNPLSKTKFTIPPISDFSIVLRKIHRMRKPVYMAAMHLRSLYDFEYLGVSLSDVLSDKTKPSIYTRQLRLTRRMQAAQVEQIQTIQVVQTQTIQVAQETEAQTTQSAILESEQSSLSEVTSSQVKTEQNSSTQFPSITPLEQSIAISPPAFEQDLYLIEALDEEYDDFIELEIQRKQQLHNFYKCLQKNWWNSLNFFQYFATLPNEFQNHRQEILRAMAIAYCINYHNLASLWEARDFFTTEFDITIQNQGNVTTSIPKLTFWQKINKISRKFRSYFKKDDYGRAIWEQIWKDLGYGLQYGDQEKQWCWNAYLAKQHIVERLLDVVKNSNGILSSQDIITDILQNSTPWTEELVSLRTIQTLAVMDVQNYQNHIATLGGYDTSIITKVY